MKMCKKVCFLIIFCFLILLNLSGCECKHKNTTLEHAVAPTCTTEGYTGDVFCAVCNVFLERGEIIPANGHTLISCGDEVEATCHSLGYTGTGKCSDCNELVKGEIINKTEHFYEDNICTVCGWKEPGLYIDDALVMSWKDLETNGYVTVKNGELMTCVGNFGGGCLSLGEDVTYIDGNHRHPFRDVDLSEIWLPNSINKLDSYLLYDNRTVKNVYMDCDISFIPECSFRRASELQKVVIPDTVESIGQQAFAGCSNLKEIIFPEGIKTICREAFYGSALQSVVFPSTLETLGLASFGATKLVEVELPPSMNTMYEEVFARCENLESVDMSLCNNLNDIGSCIFGSCTSLASIKFPPNLKSFYGYGIFSAPEGGKMLSLETLVLPEGFSGFGGEHFRTASNIAYVWWPKSLIDGTALSICNLKEIHYYGTEAEWKMVAGNDLFPNAVVTFNNKYPYFSDTDEGSVLETASDSFN